MHAGPDPSDIVGGRILGNLDGDDAEDGPFKLVKGPVFTNVLLADEINRATPRAQSALLEAMQERQVTLYDRTHTLSAPFFVVATQNPIEMEGTYPLPEAQLDRFLFKLELELPPLSDVCEILGMTTGAAPEDAGPRLDRGELLELQALVREVTAPSDVIERVGRLVLATHPGNGTAPTAVRDAVRYGSSIRGGQAILLASKARALRARRDQRVDGGRRVGRRPRAPPPTRAELRGRGRRARRRRRRPGRPRGHGLIESSRISARRADPRAAR